LWLSNPIQYGTNDLFITAVAKDFIGFMQKRQKIERGQQNSATLSPKLKVRYI
jgi:hypothetical protein